MNKLDCIDQIVNSYGEFAEQVDQNPDYDIPEGLPYINLEVRTAKKVELYVLVDANTSDDIVKDIDEAIDSLRHAAVQVQEKGNRILCQWIQLFNADHDKLKKYEPQIARLLERKQLDYLQPELLLRTLFDSTAKRLYHQTERPVLN